MALSIFSIDPQMGSIDTPIDSKIVIEFDQPIDPFTVENGVALYVVSEGLWIGSELAVLDTKYRDVLSVGNENTYFAYTSEVNEDLTKLTITPSIGLLPNKKHFVQILPGNDATRYLSAKTWADPVYTRVGTSTGTIKPISSYTGKESDVYAITFSASLDGSVDTLDVSKGGMYIGTFKAVNGVANIGLISLSISGSFDVDDLVELDVFAASGVTDINQTSFITNEYNTVVKQSFKIETLNQITDDPLVIVDISPKNNSINNQKMNPIVIKFNKPLDDTQDFTELLDLTKVDMSTGEERKISFIPVVNGNIVKLYLNSVA